MGHAGKMECSCAVKTAQLLTTLGALAMVSPSARQSHLPVHGHGIVAPCNAPGQCMIAEETFFEQLVCF